MKAYVIALTQIPESLAVAQRCVESGKRFGLDIEVRHGVWRDDAVQAMEDAGLKPYELHEAYSRSDSVIGNFMSQYGLWRDISRGTEPAIIMEHDAVVVAPIPHIPARITLVNLGRPSFGRVRKPPAEATGFYPLFSRPDKLPGAHGYYLTPARAAELVSVAKRVGVIVADKFISPQRFAGIFECYPWPIEAHDSFSTIQHERGCIAKHNYGPEYKLL